MNVNSNIPNTINQYSNNIDTEIVSNTLTVNSLKLMDNIMKLNNNDTNSNNNNSNNNNINNINNMSINSVENIREVASSGNVDSKNYLINQPITQPIRTNLPNQTPQQQSNLQDLNQGYNQLPMDQYQTSVQGQGSFLDLNQNIPPPLPGTDNQPNNLILSSLEQQYFSDFLESFLVDSDADLMNNDTLPNPPNFDNMNNDLNIKSDYFPIQNSNLF
ncbi:hypothetical protein BCR32DRAFT_109130, partial [Anaeromyces robustus]